MPCSNCSTAGRPIKNAIMGPTMMPPQQSGGPPPPIGPTGPAGGQPARPGPAAPQQQPGVARPILIAVGALVAYLIVGITLGLGLSLILAEMLGPSMPGISYAHGSLIGSILAAAIALPIFYLVASTGGRRTFLYLRPIKARHLLVALKYYGFYILPVLLIRLIAYLLGQDPDAADPSGSEILFSSEILLAFVALVVVAPFLEEVICRGYLFAKLRRRFDFWPAFWISGGIFTFAHVGYWLNPLALLQTGVAAYFMTRAFEKTRNLWAALIIHALHNLQLFAFAYLL